MVPADDKDNSRLIVSKIVLQTLEAMQLQLPEASAERLRELDTLRQELMA